MDIPDNEKALLQQCVNAKMMDILRETSILPYQIRDTNDRRRVVTNARAELIAYLRTHVFDGVGPATKGHICIGHPTEGLDPTDWQPLSTATIAELIGMTKAGVDAVLDRPKMETRVKRVLAEVFDEGE